MKRHLFGTLLLLAAAIALLSSSPASAQILGKMLYSEKGGRLEQNFSPPGRLSEVSLKAAEVEGTTKKELDCGYPGGTVLEVAGSLTVGGGSYKVEFEHQGQVSLTLEAKDGSSSEGRALVTVGAQGILTFEVTAGQARNVVMNLKVSPPGAGESATPDAAGSQPAARGDSEVKYSPGSKAALHQSPKVTLNYENAEVSEVLQDIARQTGKKIRAWSAKGRVTVQLREATAQEALELVLAGQALDSFVQVRGDEVEIMTLAPASQRDSSAGNTQPYKSIERTNTGF